MIIICSNYAHNNPYGFGGTNNNNYYVSHQPKYYTPNLNGPNNNNTKNAVSQNPPNNKVLVQYPQYQNQTQQQYSYSTQTPYYQTNIQNIKTAPVKSQQDLINQGFYQVSPNINNANINNNIQQPSNNNVQKIINIQVQKPIYPSDNTQKKSPQKQMDISQISAITNITTKTVQMPKGTRMPKSYYEYQNNPHSKSPVSQNNINYNKNVYQKQMTFTERNNANYYLNNNQNINNNKYIPQNNIYHTTKEIKRNENMNNNLQNKDQNNKDKIISITINHNKERKGSETYTIKYDNKEFPSQQKPLGKTANIKIKKLEEPRDEYPVPSDFSPKDKNTSDYNTQSNSNKSKEKYKNISNEKNEHKKHQRNDSFPMPESDEEKEKEKDKSHDSKNDDDSENLEELIDFKLGEEVCPEPEDGKYNLLNDDNEKEKEDNYEKTMKQKIMEKTVERPTIGVPPPGTNPNDNFDLDEDDDNNGVFQTNKNNIFSSDDINFEI